MTVFVIKKQWWNDVSDGKPHWSTERDSVNIDEPEELVIKMVDSLNDKFYKEKAEDLDDEHHHYLKILENAKTKLESLKTLSDEAKAAFDISPEQVEADIVRINGLIDENRAVYDDVINKRAGLDKERYIYTKLQLHGIASLSSGLKLVKKV